MKGYMNTMYYHQYHTGLVQWCFKYDRTPWKQLLCWLQCCFLKVCNHVGRTNYLRIYYEIITAMESRFCGKDHKRVPRTTPLYDHNSF